MDHVIWTGRNHIRDTHQTCPSSILIMWCDYQALALRRTNLGLVALQGASWTSTKFSLSEKENKLEEIFLKKLMRIWEEKVTDVVLNFPIMTLRMKGSPLRWVLADSFQERHLKSEGLFYFSSFSRGKSPKDNTF